MRPIVRGVAAGLIATVVLSLVLIAIQGLHVTPQLDLMAVLAHALGYRTAAGGWGANFVIGALLWGTIFSWLDRYTFFDHWMNGLLFGCTVWLGVMLFIMPAAGEGLFGLDLGLEIPSVLLVLHWIYGLVLGASYGYLEQPAIASKFFALRA